MSRKQHCFAKNGKVNRNLNIGTSITIKYHSFREGLFENFTEGIFRVKTNGSVRKEMRISNKALIKPPNKPA